MIRMLIRPLGDWVRAENLFRRHGFFAQLPRKIQFKGKTFAAFAAHNIQKAIDARNFPPNSAATVFLKGTDIPLVDAGEMRGATEWKKLPDGSWYGGMSLTKVHTKSGLPIWKLALIHDQGQAIQVTDSMRAKLRGEGLVISNDTKVFIVPPRPFLQQGIRTTLRLVDKLVRLEVVKEFNKATR